jgi:thioredoxin-dependent peroxiredoxin
MKRLPTRWLAGMALVAGAFAARSVAAKGSLPEVGHPAPDFTLDTQDGKPVSLRDFRGRWVVLYFYPKDFTPGCTIEAREFREAAPKFAAKNAVVLGVSVQSPTTHKKFCAKEALGFDLLSDKSREVSAAYGSILNLGIIRLSTRHTFLINPDGVIAKEFLKVKPGSHAQEVLSALAEAQGAQTARR